MLPRLPPCLHLLRPPQSLRGTAPSSCPPPQRLSYRELTEAHPHLRGDPGQTHVHLGQAWEAEPGRVGDTDPPRAGDTGGWEQGRAACTPASPCPVWPLSPPHLSPPHRWSPCNRDQARRLGVSLQPAPGHGLHLPERRPTCCPFPSERPGNGGWERGPPPWEEEAA